jgi:hypothetical protein
VLRGEDSIAESFRTEGVHEGFHDRRSKAFLKADKTR